MNERPVLSIDDKRLSGADVDAAVREDVRLSLVLTLVVWVGCVTVGVLGLVLPYRRPVPVGPPPLRIEAKFVQVELAGTSVPHSQREEVNLPPPSPAPVPPPMRIPDAPPLAVVASPSPAVAFPVPSAGLERAEAPAQAVALLSAVRQAGSSTELAVHPLVFGEGEGKQPAPEYPRAAIRGRQEGTVRIRFTVAADGRILIAEVAVPSPWPLLNEAALWAVRERWKFPAGKVRRYEVPIRFQLKDLSW